MQIIPIKMIIFLPIGLNNIILTNDSTSELFRKTISDYLYEKTGKTLQRILKTLDGAV
jgi:hypothetical protein